ncbi:MAG: nucleotide sugar dehydrogenase [Rickettsiales bacterium]|nr:nucleotide sugar dehydrogenase [Rickettsiales bacterium]
MILDTDKIAVIGLGYVGLPLAVAFGNKRPVIGFDIAKDRVESLQNSIDKNLEVSEEELAAASQLSFTTDSDDLKQCKLFIITVPTPINSAKQPDLYPFKKASEMVARVMPKGAIVVYESTVFPGCVQNVGVEILERESGMKHNVDFFTGYSPERINPGDRNRGIVDIVKVTSGSTPETADVVDAVYASVITAGTHKASSIEVAEAAKVIENAQRDLNIAFMNELSIIFHRLGIDTQDVLEAAKTKWNFLPFSPGLVGGHCIGVDPYYLTYRAQQVGYHPEVILAGRRINDTMGQYLAERVIRLMLKARLNVAESKILIMGLTFKENCPDLRNSRVIDVIRELQTYHAQVDVCDPWVSAEDAKREYGITLVNKPNAADYDAVIIAVGHHQFIELGATNIRALCKPDGILYDVKGLFKISESEERL